MEIFDYVWKSIFMIIAGVLLLRLAGRKSISQMTIPSTVIMISVGSVIVQPIVTTSVWKTIIATASFTLSFLALEYLEIKFNFFERFMSGQSLIIIEDGEILPKNMKKLRITVDKLEMRLRQQGIQNLKDVKYATLEPNGQIGYELKKHARPVTIGDLEAMFKNFNIERQTNKESISYLFEEVKNKKHYIEPDPTLQ